MAGSAQSWDGGPDAAESASRERCSSSGDGAAAAVTGVLLVGGASSRFGSPKALARLHGETFAERGWRLLAWCDERLAVGKGADALQLPFPVLDDGAAERAPIFGVAAALRAARTSVCVVLPVDCPHMTGGALRALAAARAVPQTGPLPGAYEHAHLVELDRRIASGRLSLRGINDRTLQLDPALLADVDTADDLQRLKDAAASIRSP